ncbi:Mitogen-activated protein kinase spm1 [Neolecta irregularis DAH-3]|uniref:Mitogen-activated protein kinase n=1 Tax=Neolecta irregularis (strain DAH-3) TaxID=1198029 RepID=A0A1U7LNL7_NEOID|nr:Mitogen-activated protein kinase spm1 [Neolecta irregularis DAH-3]|eukprot:OLL24244.1 Mitogen-activated protein kinase spm1 [Neolecta irregularis DAH-3]
MTSFFSVPGGDQHRIFKVLTQEFVVDAKFQVTKELGQGAYGIVCAAKNIETGETVAIKKVTNIFSKKILTKRALREVKLLQHFRGHKNITCLYDMEIIDQINYNEVYLYEELMEADLHAIIRSGQPLTDQHYQSFIYQILCGLKYIHSANVLHRDLKPGNLLVNADCELKICDFGLARGFSENPQQNSGFMTEYVATRWYRAPEIMLSFQSYTKAIDMWSIGCILAELIGGKPFFKGRDYVDQLNQILRILGTPREETLRRIGSPRAQDYVRNLPHMAKVPFPTLFPKANPHALDLLKRLLAFDPMERISVEEALEHPYLSVWRDVADEINCPTAFQFDFEAVDDALTMRQMILDEVNNFRSAVRSQSPAPLNTSPASFQTDNIGIPESRVSFDSDLPPRPHDLSEAMDLSIYEAYSDIERELAGGLDAMQT